MEHAVLLCAVLALLIPAEAALGDDPHNKPILREDLKQLADQLSDNQQESYSNLTKQLEQLAVVLINKHEDLEKQQQASDSKLTKQLEQLDADVKERLAEGQAQLQGQLKAGDIRLQKLHSKVSKVQGRIDTGITEVAIKAIEEQKSRNEIFEKLIENFKDCSERGRGLPDSLQQQMWDMQSQLTSTRQLLDTTRAQLTATQDQLSTTQDQLSTTQDQLSTTQDQLSTTQEQLSTTRDILTAVQERSRLTEGELKVTKKQARTTQEQLSTTLRTLADVQRNAGVEGSKLRAAEVALDDVQRQVLLTQDQLQQWREEQSGDVGSVFTRWGSTTCPQNTSLVYSGWAGGSWYDHSGGGSTYLCLVQDPQLDNTTALPPHYAYLQGAEYLHVHGHDHQDVVCSVCRAEQATTIMVPATLTCPPDWITQYRGHIMSAQDDHRGRTEFVCVDEVLEHRPGGEASQGGAFFFQVVTDCGSSLPCPPYVHRQLLVTCVVCSL